MDKLTAQQSQAVAQSRARHEQSTARLREIVRKNPINFAELTFVIEEIRKDPGEFQVRQALAATPLEMILAILDMATLSMKDMSLSILETSDADAPAP